MAINNNYIKTAFIFFFMNNFLYASVPTIEDYQNSSDISAHDSYIYGLERGLEWANEYTFQKHSFEIYCKPRDLSLSSKQLRKIINDEIETNNRFYSKYKDVPLLGLALRNGYISKFPCNK